MNISKNWLQAFLRRPLDSKDVAERLAMLGATVDAIEPLHPGLGDIIIGLVEETVQHPNADRLRLCTVNDGSGERRQVVCGAPNVMAGKKYPFAPLGAVLPGGLTIEKRKLRGVASEGMLCSARELGLGQDHDGIMELDTTAAPGTRLLDALPLDDDRLVVDVTPNRPDLLGHKGVARELAASYNTPFRLPEIPGSHGSTIASPRKAEGPEAVIAGVRVNIASSDGCRRFFGAVVRGVTVAPSPAWLAQRISAIGMRPINNVVDATNYVMFELNQPMHPYDVARLTGPEIIVRRANAGETLVTLDGVSRTLTPEMIVIADQGGVVGVAGVMGAQHVEVSPSTRDVFLECAWFDPRSIRRTRRDLGLASDASYRFERGIDLWNGAEAIRRAIEIILATAGGALAEPPVDIFPVVTHPPRIFLRPARVNQILGTEVPWTAVEKALVAIGATVLSKPDDGRIAVDVPGWRPDLVKEIDLIEEIARVHGYDQIPSDLRPYRVGSLPDAPSELTDARIRSGLAASGLLEILTIPMGPADGENSVRLMNPLASDESWLRTRLLPGLIRQVEGNWRSQVGSVRLFELGTVFESAGVGKVPDESRRVAGVITGRRDPDHWTGQAPDFDLWDLKGLFDRALSLAVPGATMQVEGNIWVGINPEGEVVGRAERLTADAPPWAAPLFGFEIEINTSTRMTPRVAMPPVTPSSERDLALVLPAGVAAARAVDILRRDGGAYLESVTVLDEYRGEKLAGEGRSVMFHLVFRAPDRTLEKSEVDQASARILKSLENELRVHIREA
ncbi:MAG: phenylalanine--tRNA ligase subunit beta [Gemmatimonadota bacterium]